jgi:hypothetical protein
MIKKLLLVYILYIPIANAHCRVANNEIVCDNSNTLIETYNALIRPVQPLVNIYITNQNTHIIDNNFNFDLLQEKRFENLQKLQTAPNNFIQNR